MRRCAILALLLAASSLAAQDSAGLFPVGRYYGVGLTAAEIVAWHAPSRTAFVINGRRKTVDVVKVAPAEGSFFMEPASIDLVAAASAAGVEFGDVTSIAVSPDDSCIAAAIQYNKLCIFGGRSFTILDSETLDVVFDSGSDFERISSERYPGFFNASNDNLKIDSRSPKKGPEPEGAAIGSVGSRIYAFIGFERIGGIMVYDVTEASKSRFVTYANSRDFSDDVAGDSGPEGLCWIPADKSPLSCAVLLSANETSGTVAAFGAILPK